MQADLGGRRRATGSRAAAAPPANTHPTLFELGVYVYVCVCMCMYCMYVHVYLCMCMYMYVWYV